ncbi:MAG: hypothetical protein ACK48S_04750 [Planctomycetia bacterium]|jgi:hypothetical protein
MADEFVSLGQVSKRLGIPLHRLAYALVNGKVPDCEKRFVGRRAFSESEIQILKDYFDAKDAKRKAKA